MTAPVAPAPPVAAGAAKWTQSTQVFGQATSVTVTRPKTAAVKDDVRIIAISSADAELPAFVITDTSSAVYVALPQATAVPHAIVDAGGNTAVAVLTSAVVSASAIDGGKTTVTFTTPATNPKARLSSYASAGQ